MTIFVPKTFDIVLFIVVKSGPDDSEAAGEEMLTTRTVLEPVGADEGFGAARGNEEEVEGFFF